MWKMEVEEFTLSNLQAIQLDCYSLDLHSRLNEYETEQSHLVCKARVEPSNPPPLDPRKW